MSFYYPKLNIQKQPKLQCVGITRISFPKKKKIKVLSRAAMISPLNNWLKK